MVRLRKSLDEIVEARREGAIRAYRQGKPSNLTSKQRGKWLEGIYKD